MLSAVRKQEQEHNLPCRVLILLNELHISGYFGFLYEKSTISSPYIDVQHGTAILHLSVTDLFFTLSFAIPKFLFFSFFCKVA